MEKELKLTVNGEPHKLLVKPRTTLLELLRDDLGLKGAKQACVSNSCGYCTVILDDMSVKACSYLPHKAGNMITKKDAVKLLTGGPEGLKQWNDLADAGEGFSYANLNKALRVLMRGGPVIAVAKHR